MEWKARQINGAGAVYYTSGRYMITRESPGTWSVSVRPGFGPVEKGRGGYCLRTGFESMGAAMDYAAGIMGGEHGKE